MNIIGIDIKSTADTLVIIFSWFSSMALGILFFDLRILQSVDMSQQLDDILSGLKTRTIDIHEQSNQPIVSTVEEDSMISISSLKDLQNTTMPKKSNRRRNRSDKNTISLDI